MCGHTERERERERERKREKEREKEKRERENQREKMYGCIYVFMHTCVYVRIHTRTHTHTLEPRNISPDAGRILKSALHRDLNSKCTMTSCFQKYLGRYAHVLKGSGRWCRALET